MNYLQKLRDKAAPVNPKIQRLARQAAENAYRATHALDLPNKIILKYWLLTRSMRHGLAGKVNGLAAKAIILLYRGHPKAEIARRLDIKVHRLDRWQQSYEHFMRYNGPEAIERVFDPEPWQNARRKDGLTLPWNHVKKTKIIGPTRPKKAICPHCGGKGRITI